MNPRWYQVMLYVAAYLLWAGYAATGQIGLLLACWMCCGAAEVIRHWSIKRGIPFPF